MEKAELDARIVELETKKSLLIEKIKELNTTIRIKERQLERSAGAENSGPRPGVIMRELEQMEFRIATSAYTAKIEKEMIKKVKELQAELAVARETERKRKKVMFAEGDLKVASEERAKIEIELNVIRAELKTLYGSKKDSANAERREKQDDNRHRTNNDRKRRDDREFRDENAQHLKPFERFVSLEEIVLIKKAD